jgi:HK97 family phage major capsid protein
MSEDLIAKLTELTNLVKDRGGTKEMDIDGLKKAFSDALREVDVERQATVPVHAGEDYQNAGVEKAVAAYKGKYQTEIKSIAKSGTYGNGRNQLTGVDLDMAKTLLENASQRIPGSDPLCNPPSDDLKAAVKAMSSTGTGTGDELVPTGLASQLWNDFFVASKVAADLPAIQMPVDPFPVPLGLGDVTWRKGTQSTATTATDLATAQSTLTTTEQVAEVDWSYTLDEDAVIAMMPAVRARLALSAGEQMDYFCLNADSTATGSANINKIEGTPAAGDSYMTAGQMGIRYKTLVDYTTSGSNAAGAALTDAIMGKTLKLAGKYALDYQNFRIVPEIQTYFDMVGLTNVATVDKYGAAATIVRGELGRYRNIPIIPSASMFLAMNDGKVGNTASNLYGSWVGYHVPSWFVGYRRTPLYEVWRDVQKRMLILVVSFRIAIGCYGTRSTAKHTISNYYLTV